jgi:putative phosphoribosyl transferase
MTLSVQQQTVRIPCGTVEVEGMLELPAAARGVVLFAHGSGSSRFSPRNNHVARILREAGIATLLVDLLTPGEDRLYRTRFDISLLTDRLRAAADWLRQCQATHALPVGLFGASTGAAAALQLAAAREHDIAAVVSRGGRPDLAGETALAAVLAPTLLIVGGLDTAVLELNRTAYAALACEKRLDIVPGASHLFDEAGTLEAVASLASGWFAQHLARAGQ